MTQLDQVSNNELFSASALFYARLRRVNSRVIDVVYMAENEDYARYAIALAQDCNDPELNRLSERLQGLMGFDEGAELIHAPEQENGEDPYYEATPEEVYKAQVSHHYIGALR